MAGEILKLTAAIVTSHASTTELTTTELVKEIKAVSCLLSSLAGEAAVPVPESPLVRFAGSRKSRSRKMVASLEAKAVPDEEKPVLGDPDYLEFMASREG